MKNLFYVFLTMGFLGTSIIGCSVDSFTAGNSESSSKSVAVEKDVVTSRAIKTYEGTLKNIYIETSSTGEIKVQPDDSTYEVIKHEVAWYTKIRRDGKKISLRDLRKSDRLKITYNSLKKLKTAYVIIVL